MQIIREAEGYERGFYTGITGYFDGDNMDSAVMIRLWSKRRTECILKAVVVLLSRVMPTVNMKK